MHHVLDQLVRTRIGRDLARALYRVGVAREAIDAALAREVDAAIVVRAVVDDADDALSREYNTFLVA